MTPERWGRVKQVYQMALEHPPGDRLAFVREECGEDTDLLREVERMLAERSADSRIESAFRDFRESVEEPPFPGTDRFAVRHRVGSGGFGEVYLVDDNRRGVPLALKVLSKTKTNPETLRRFKQEFRGLADILHRNLVALYELQSEQDQWFFTMEFVSGENFYDYGVSIRPDFGRLRLALAELAAGVRELHRHDKLHRDLKPENVLVEPGGRVVILDFGLATGITDGESGGSGTLKYMSPEQAQGLPLSEASDWYSVGVMLYECLTGHRLEIPPHERDPLPLSQLRPDAPADLSALCMQLLQRDPALRPSTADIQSRLPAVPENQEWVDLGEPASLIGRENELRALHEAFREAGRGRLTMVKMHGPSGVGKSALASQFIREARAQCLVLEGRCSERESVPYKALDSLVDGLNRWLRSLTEDERKPLLPPGFQALAQMFPVLEDLDVTPQANVESVIRQVTEQLGGLIREAPAKSYGQRMRLRGFQALSELLAALAARKPPLVLVIDDLQWGDADSAAFLQYLLSRGDPLPILFLFIYRSDEAQSSPLLRRFLKEDAAAHKIDMPVRDLNEEAARTLALQLLQRDPRISPEAAEHLAVGIAKDSGRSPYLIEELVRYAQSGETGANPVLLENLIQVRVAKLSEHTRSLLEVVALAGQPIDLAIATTASQLDTGAYAEVRQLRRGNLIRIRSTDDSEELEPYHDRIREKVEGSLSSDTSRQYHLRLAMAGESSPKVHPRFLARHFRGAGSDQPAYHYAIKAADQAESVFAYEDAIECYRLSIAVASEGSADRVWSQLKLSIALYNAGRIEEGARVYFGVTDRAERDYLERIALDEVLQFRLDQFDRTIFADFEPFLTQHQAEGDEEY
jgi:hypothetical protein